MDDNVLFEISNDAKIEYLNSLIGKMHKILHLVEEKENTGFSPKPFIAGQLFEINAANNMFDGKLITVLVKVRGIYDICNDITVDETKKQIFEIVRILRALLKKVG